MSKFTEMILDLGYTLKLWQENQTKIYKNMYEGKKMYVATFNKPEISTFEPWEGQRP
jgi:hypothetical protein